MVYRVLVSDSLSQEGVDILQSHDDVQVDVKTGLNPSQLAEIIPEYDALVIRSASKVTREVLEKAGKLKVVGRAGVGIDNVDLEAATQRGVIVMNTPGGNTVSTAELTWAMIMCLARKIHSASLTMREGKWEKKKLTGTELFGKTLGVIGMGRIGTVVGKRALAFNMNVLGYDPFISQDQIQQMGFTPVSLDELLSQADIITVHTTKTKETTHLLDDQAFAKMKKGVRIINCARGGLVDEAALLRALESGKCAGAALDVFEQEPPPPDHPLLKRDDCVFTPHLGASTEEAQTNVAIDIAHNVLDALLGKEVRNAINIPSISPEQKQILGPYIVLAEKLGMFAVQYLGKHVGKLEVTYAGSISEQNTSILTIAVLKGLLTPIMDETVNFVNATVLAEKRQIQYSEIKTKKADGYSNLLTVRLISGDDEVEICGTNFGENDPRIVRIDHVFIETKPFGHVLFIKNVDLPGVIGHIGSVLSQSNINIADMSLGRHERGGTAITLCNIDASISDTILQQLRSLDTIKEVKVMNLRA